MTIARKLWLGFGGLILIFVIACLVIFLSERVVSNALGEIVEVEEPTRAASYEMEINTAEMARDVLDYLQTGDPRYREEFREDRADFERFKDRYDRLVDTENGERHGERIESLYEEYAALGEDLISSRPSDDPSLSSDERRFLELQAELDAVFDEQVQPWTGRQLKDAEGEAGDAVRGLYTALAALLLAGLLVGGLTATLINRGIIGSVRRLTEGANRVGRGDLEHRIELDTTDELGTVAAAFNAMLDRRREADAALQEGEEKFRGLSDATFEGVATNEGGEILEANRAFAQMFGYEVTEILGMSTLDFTLPEYHDLALEHARSGSEEPFEAVGVRKDGTELDIEVRNKALNRDSRHIMVTAVRDVTERKRVERRLRETEARYRELVEQLPAIIYVQEWAEPGATTYISPQAERVLGYPLQRFTSDPEWWVGLLHPDDRDRVLAEHERTNEAGDAFRTEYRMRASDGRYLWFSDEAELVRDEEGRPLYWQGVQVDVTERKEAEEKLKRSEERFRLVAQATNEVIWDNDLRTNAQVWDGAIEAMFGYSPGEVGDDAGWWEERLHPDDRERVVSSTEAFVRDSGEIWSEEYRFRRADGTYAEVADRALLVRDEAGEPVRMLGSMMDVTERRRAEEELRESEERYRTLVETVQEGIAFVAPEGGVINYCNEAYAEILGLTPDEIVGKSFFDFLEGKEREKTLRQRELRHEGVSSAYEVTATAADGTEKIISATGSPIFHADGSYAGAVQTIVDVTESRRAERELREAEERFRSAFDDAAIGMALNDLDGRFTQVNRSLCEMLGYTEEELLSRSFRDITHPDDLDASADRVGKLLRGEIEGYGLEKRYLHANGHPVWVALSVSAVRDPQGRPLYLIAQMQDVTERKAAETQLRKSQASLAEAQRMARIGNWEYDLTTEEVIWSDEVFRVYGFAPQEFVPTFERLLEMVHPDDRHLLIERLEGAVDRDEPYDFEHRVILPDGTERIVHRRARVVRDEDGGPLRMVGTVQNVTERKRAEEEIRELNETLERRVEERTAQLRDTLAELRESEERYSLVVAGSNDGIFDWDIPAGTIFWNDRLFEILGLSPSDFTPTIEDFFGLVHPEDRQRVSESLTAHLERGEEFDVEFGMRHADGSYRACVSRGKAQRGENGRPYRMAGSLSDITERKRAEEELRLRDRAIAASSNGIVISDPTLPDNPLIYVNPAFEAMTGYAAEEAIGYNCRFLQGSDRDQPTLDELRAAVREGRERQVVLRNYRKDGSLFYNELSVSPVRDGAGNITHFVGIQNDVTERKRAEEEIRELNETLESRVEERTAQLRSAIVELEWASGNLRSAKEEAESANRAKSEFLANMSHEIRTPMNGVIGMTGLLLDTDLADEQREYVDTIRLSGESLLSIINDILDFSKIEAGEMRLEAINFDLRTAVEDVVAIFAERAHDKGLELACLVDYDVPTALEGDPGRIRQILTNLIGNAIKFTEEGEVVLRAELVEENPERATVRISVKDTGIGMTEDQQERVFESFSQADASTTRRYGGTGLGLTISRQLVELMGGEIGVESEPDVGSTFFFTLPLKKQPGNARRAPGPLTDLKDLRVLIVDDNDTNRHILRKQLSSWGMENSEAEDGFAALEALRTAAGRGESYDLVILDMQMPGMDGMELARRIGADPAVSQTRLLLLTSIGQRGDGEYARKAGIEAYLTKPVRQSELYDAIATVMGTPERTRAERAPLVTRHTLREMNTVARAHLLLAEDNPVNQKVAARMLERLGYRVDVAQNGLEALEALSRNRYAAVLMDVQMPEMDGYEATAEIRRREAARAWGGEHHSTPIIAMTANAMQGDREKALAAGMDDYLPKPVRQESLEEVLDRWVSREDAAAVSAAAGDGRRDLTASAGNGQALDPAVLAGLRELGDAELLAELAGMFFDDAASRLEDLRQAVAEGDAGAVERVAHTLKGSSGNIGAARMAAICAELQGVGSSGDLARAGELLGRLEEEFGRVRPALEAEVEGGS